jgi:ABC-2 type transport system permease protein
VRLFPAGSILWLLAHELRLAWRGRTRSGARRARIWIVMSIVLAALCIPGWLLAGALKPLALKVTPDLALGVDVGALFLFTLMTSATVSNAAVAFFERSDLDLLLSSPIPPRRVLTVRCVGIALNSAILWILLISPFAGPGIVRGDLRWIGVYPLLIGLGLLATALGLSIATALFRLIGPRRTRAAATVVSAVIGVSFGLLGQARTVLGRDVYGELWGHLKTFAANGFFDNDTPLAWPARALFGELPISASLFGGALLIFALVTQSVGRRFGEDAAAAAGAGERARTASGGVKPFASGVFGVTVAKELRLIRRDGTLLSQTLIQVVYLAALFGAYLFRFASSSNAMLDAGAAALLVFLSGQLAAVFGWIVMSAEDAPELLAASPAHARILRRGKLVAALIPVAFILAVPIAVLGWIHLWAGLGALIGCAAIAWSSVLLAIWFERPGKRSELRRRRNGSLTGALIGGFLGLCWSGAAFLIGMGPPWAFAAIGPAVVALVVLGAVSRPEQSFAERLQAA